MIAEVHRASVQGAKGAGGGVGGDGGERTGVFNEKATHAKVQILHDIIAALATICHCLSVDQLPHIWINAQHIISVVLQYIPCIGPTSGIGSICNYMRLQPFALITTATTCASAANIHSITASEPNCPPSPPTPFHLQPPTWVGAYLQ